MLTLDNSGSMEWATLPGEEPRFDVHDASASAQVAYWKSSHWNRLFYDPALRYVPWQKADGTFFPDANPAAAWQDLRLASSPLVNLTVPDTCRSGSNGSSTCPESLLVRNYLAFYYRYLGGDAQDLASYQRMTIDRHWQGESKSLDRTDCAGARCTWQEELQNFANWYSYYRKRIFSAIAAISQSFSALDGQQRVGFGQLNNPRGNRVDGQENDTVLQGVRDFSGASRAAFYARLFQGSVQGGATPLRRAMDDVGQYFSRTDELGPWAEFPGRAAGTPVACRKSFHILLTDGYWNGPAAPTEAARHADQVDGPPLRDPQSGASMRYLSGQSPYYNSPFDSTLADVAMYYWNHDLNPELADRVPGSSLDPAFWQHLVQYTVGLGLAGTLRYPGDEAALKNGRLRWPDPGSGDNPAAVDDLWHAAVNGHGLYLNPTQPKALRDGLQHILADIARNHAAAASPALTQDPLRGNAPLAYLPGYEAGSWRGHLVARDLDASGHAAADRSARWDAADLLPAWQERRIFTLNPARQSVVEFRFDNLAAADQARLSPRLVDYLRGNEASEQGQPDGTLRSRAGKLGDIINSSPVLVHRLDHGYAGLPGYTAFVAGKAARTPTLYVGANDGMLHAFDGNTGIETFAFVPQAVLPTLPLLADPAYRHHYFVDGPLTEGDAKNSGGQWKTLLAGSTGAGARAVFMLDVSQSGNSSAPALGAHSVLWERDGASGDESGAGGSADPDLGHVLGKIEVVRLKGGRWAALLGNGYGSSNGRAVLYLLDAFTGALLHKITLPAAQSGANGLSAPAPLFNAARELVATYAGDLQGNLWRIDFADQGRPEVAYDGQPLFIASNPGNPGTGGPQPIIVRPALAPHPQGGYLVLFGTGKWFDEGDVADTRLQSAYGIWDNNRSPLNRFAARDQVLQGQTLTRQSGGASLSSIGVDWRSKRGWWVDLNLFPGARAVGDPFVTDERTFWLNVLGPGTASAGASCEAAGAGQLIAFDWLSGGASSVFDTASSSAHLSAIDIGPSLRTPRVMRLGSTPATSPACTPPNCPAPGVPEVACPGRSLLLTLADGSQAVRTVAGQCQPPLRTWHQLETAF
jgi:type IV pilus assembly protein PilY1